MDEEQLFENLIKEEASRLCAKGIRIQDALLFYSSWPVLGAGVLPFVVQSSSSAATVLSLLIVVSLSLMVFRARTVNAVLGNNC